MAIDVKKTEAIGKPGAYGSQGQQLNAAINMATELLAHLDDPRVQAVDADLSAVEEGCARVPVIVRADMADGQAVYHLQKKLADQIFGPVYHKTRVSMPMIMLSPTENPRLEMVSDTGLLFPLLGHRS